MNKHEINNLLTEAETRQGSRGARWPNGAPFTAEEATACIRYMDTHDITEIDHGTAQAVVTRPALPRRVRSVPSTGRG